MASICTLDYIRNGSIHIVGTALLAGVMATACSSSDSGQPADDGQLVDPDNDNVPGLAIEGLNGTPADQLTSPWLANISFFRLDSQTPGTGDAFIKLLQYSDDFEVSNHVEFYTPELDTCEIRDLNDDDDENGGSNPPPAISGGQTLTINTPSGPWFELQATSGSIGVYETDDGLPGAFPDGLTLSIPGDTFPMVAAYPLMEPTPPIRLLPASDVLTLTDITAPFTWIPGADVPGGYMELVGIAYDNADNFAGFPIICKVQDVGSFTMPQEVVDAFTATEFTIRARFERIIKRIDLIDGIVFHQKTTIAE